MSRHGRKAPNGDALERILREADGTLEDDELLLHHAAMLDPDSLPMPETILDAFDRGLRMEDDPPGMAPVAVYLDEAVIRSMIARHGRGWQHEVNRTLVRAMQEEADRTGRAA